MHLNKGSATANNISGCSFNGQIYSVRYCNNKGEIIDQIVLEEYMYGLLRKIKKKYGAADLIMRINDTEYVLE